MTLRSNGGCIDLIGMGMSHPFVGVLIVRWGCEVEANQERRRVWLLLSDNKLMAFSMLNESICPVEVAPALPRLRVLRALWS